MTRKDNLLKLRPEINIITEYDRSEYERFQNVVIRPIIKFQHEHIIQVFQHDQQVVKSNFDRLDSTEQETTILKILKQNHKLKIHLMHVVTSMMSIEEYSVFLESKGEYKRRINSIITKRIKDTLAI